jgi:hypothetical protein
MGQRTTDDPQTGHGHGNMEKAQVSTGTFQTQHGGGRDKAGTLPRPSTKLHGHSKMTYTSHGRETQLHGNDMNRVHTLFRHTTDILYVVSRGQDNEQKLTRQISAEMAPKAGHCLYMYCTQVFSTRKGTIMDYVWHMHLKGTILTRAKPLHFYEHISDIASWTMHGHCTDGHG